MANYYNAVLKSIGEDCVKVKIYGNRIKKGGRRPKKSKVELDEEIRKIEMDMRLSAEEKLVLIAVLKDKRKKEGNDVPKGRKLYPKEMEEFSDLMDINFKRGDKYVTLTYAKEDVSLDEAGRDFENWIKRMREKYGGFKYLGVRSFQERGTIHFHVLMTIPDIPKTDVENGVFRSMWGHGNVDIKKIYRLNKTARYAKLKNYLLGNLQEFKSDKRSSGKRLLLKSKNLEKPVVIKGTHQEIMENLNNLGDEYDLKKIDSYKFKHEYLNYIASTTYLLVPKKAKIDL